MALGQASIAQMGPQETGAAGDHRDGRMTHSIAFLCAHYTQDVSRMQCRRAGRGARGSEGAFWEGIG
jgi:hypothetical protein